ncbi:MAG TPA: isoprenyl transferase [Firmicutes bacterium]|nr:isoprenyl transferase [Bacillota bacterium]
MDGNGRWATRRGLPRVFGHRRGVERVREVATFCGKAGVRYLTLYAFSTENWRRPREEVDALMGILEETIRKEARALVENNVKAKVIGEREGLPASLCRAIEELEAKTAGCTGLVLCLAINYGGRREITGAVRRIAGKVRDGLLEADAISEEVISSYLYTAGIPDPDLVIRTSGEMRMSNFLTWQTVYSELWFTRTLWPDFSTRELAAAIRSYQSRERRFGGRGKTRGESDVC